MMLHNSTPSSIANSSVAMYNNTIPSMYNSTPQTTSTVYPATTNSQMSSYPSLSMTTTNSFNSFPNNCASQSFSSSGISNGQGCQDFSNTQNIAPNGQVMNTQPYSTATPSTIQSLSHTNLASTPIFSGHPIASYPQQTMNTMPSVNMNSYQVIPNIQGMPMQGMMSVPIQTTPATNSPVVTTARLPNGQTSQSYLYGPGMHYFCIVETGHVTQCAGCAQCQIPATNPSNMMLSHQFGANANPQQLMQWQTQLQLAQQQIQLQQAMIAQQMQQAQLQQQIHQQAHLHALQGSQQPIPSQPSQFGPSPPQQQVVIPPQPQIPQVTVTMHTTNVVQPPFPSHSSNVLTSQPSSNSHVQILQPNGTLSVASPPTSTSSVLKAPVPQTQASSSLTTIPSLSSLNNSSTIPSISSVSHALPSIGDKPLLSGLAPTTTTSTSGNGYTSVPNDYKFPAKIQEVLDAVKAEDQQDARTNKPVVPLTTCTALYPTPLPLLSDSKELGSIASAVAPSTTAGSNVSPVTTNSSDSSSSDSSIPKKSNPVESLSPIPLAPNSIANTVVRTSTAPPAPISTAPIISPYMVPGYYDNTQKVAPAKAAKSSFKPGCGPNSRRPRAIAEQKKLVELFLAGDMSVRKFCKIHKVAAATLKHWRENYQLLETQGIDKFSDRTGRPSRIDNSALIDLLNKRLSVCKTITMNCVQMLCMEAAKETTRKRKMLNNCFDSCDEYTKKSDEKLIVSRSTLDKYCGIVRAELLSRKIAIIDDVYHNGDHPRDQTTSNFVQWMRTGPNNVDVEIVDEEDDDDESSSLASMDEEEQNDGEDIVGDV